MNENLLIIEDEALLGNELARFFRKQGWDAALAQSLEDARYFLFEQPQEPLVVISDMNLPDGNA
ncbi:MAG: sigma-54-dependent transcriptional regulator, partial [Gammaproteobacteria bacterium]